MSDKLNQKSNKVKEIFNKIVYKKPRLVVAIGASAGGLEAVEKMCGSLPTNLGISYVLIQHLAPHKQSYMKQILEAKSNLAFESVRHLSQVKADTFHIIAERANVKVVDEQFYISEINAEDFTYPINIFLESLASEYGASAAAVILSGSGTDGARGVSTIASAGGLTIVQQPDTAAFDSMPLAAIETGKVSSVLPVEEIGATLANHIENLTNSESFFQIDNEESTETIKKMYTLLRTRVGVDFTRYKPNTFNRRLKHRMGMTGSVTIIDYLALLESDPKETQALIEELLVGVTEFFRDNDRWSAVRERYLLNLVNENQGRSELRFWSVGCSTGQEAYSLTILLLELYEELGIAPKFKVFATDVVGTAVTKAGMGIYAKEEYDEIPFEFKSKYFEVSKEDCIVREEVRSRLIFAKHDIVESPPFSNMDMIICRNVLIYLKPSTTDDVIAKLHFALKSTGVLFLGDSESLGSYRDYFRIDSECRFLYHKLAEKRIPLHSLQMSREQFERSQGYSSRTLLRASNAVSGRTQKFNYSTKLRDVVIDQFIPASIVLNKQKEIVYSFGDTEKYTVKLSQGAHSPHFSSNLRAELVPLVETLILELEAGKNRVVLSDVTIKAEQINFSIEARKLEFKEKEINAAFMVCFSDPINVAVTGNKPVTSGDGELQGGNRQERKIRMLDSELVNAKLLIDETQKNLDLVTEELQVSNEELMASNEELHSVNEELFTVNSELNEKVSEMQGLSDELSLVLETMRSGVIFLNSDFTIRRFTSAVRQYFNLLPVDINRPIIDFLGRIDTKDFHQMLDKIKHEHVNISRKIKVEVEVPDEHGPMFVNLKVSMIVIPESSKIQPGYMILVQVD